ncbi:MAG: glucose-6-phosphate dehydrogenase [Bacteroidales bacterium]|nr:glucose-6-phosphate dehydrogenase [Bacteroidales bacterium]
MNRPENQILVIFGASGDLTKRKLIPALYSLEVLGLLPEKFAIIGVSRSGMNDEIFREIIKDGLLKFSEEKDKSGIDAFLQKVSFLSINAEDPATYPQLSHKLSELRQSLDIPGNTIYYLSTPPNLYGVIPRNLAQNLMNNPDDGWKRVIIEKPFGYDLQSAIDLNTSLLGSWQEDQIYRIDHYLGKETVQNVLVTRFTNGIFEPLWNRNYVHHVEITSAESIGVENRGPYYEGSGALRDMIQNHLLQVVGLIAMEPPASLNSDAIRNETVKVLQSIRPYSPEEVVKSVIRGQYLASTIKGEPIKGYRDETGVDPHSKTETYAALKFYIDNWRWGGVPFYIRTGKRLPTRVSEAVIHFKPTPHYLFAGDRNNESHNKLVIRIQPDEGMLLKFGMKMPGKGFDVHTVNMDFHYTDLSIDRIPDAYERLLLDCMTGDSTLFARGDAVMATWKFLDPVLEAWKNNSCIPVLGYPAGTWGPERADDLIEEPNMTWRYPCKNLSDDGIYCEL